MKKSIASHLFPLRIWKKSFLIFLFPLLTLALASGQVSFGIKGGPTFSSMNYGYAGFNTESLTAWHAGIVTGFKFGSKLFIQPEILYSVKGARLNDQSGIEPVKMEAQFISIPVMLGYSINALSLRAGPELNLRVGVDEERFVGLSDDNLFNKTEVSLGAGIAYTFLEKLGVEFRYNFGLTEAGNLTFTDVNGNILEDDSDGKIKTIQLSVFYLFKS